MRSYSYSRVTRNCKTGDENEISIERGEVVEVLNEGQTSKEAKRLKLDLGGEISDILDSSAAKHKLAIRPKKRYADSRHRNATLVSESNRCLIRTTEDVPGEGWVPSEVLERESDDHGDELSHVRCKREAVVKELLETEEEFNRDLVYVVENYLTPAVDASSVPRIVRDNADIIFNNFKQISNFHNTTLIEGIKYYSNEPRMLGKTFLRLERDFDKHTTYCRDEPVAQEFLAENSEVSEFFEELSQKLGDGKSLSEYLKLPVQRINDYQVLLKDLVKYSGKLGENTNDLKRALELMLAVPQRANDNKFLSNIEGFHGNIHKLGRLLKHDWFAVTSDEGGPKERYLFLFKGHILVCKVKKISEDRSVFTLKDQISLSEAKIKNCSDEKTFEVFSDEPQVADGNIKICARRDSTKTNWLNEIEKNFPCVFDIKKSTDEDLKTVDDVPSENRLHEGNLKQSPKEQIESLDEKDTEPVAVETTSSAEAENKIRTVQIRKEATDKADNMSRRLSTRKSQKSYEESYSVSSQQEVYMTSSTSSRKFSATSVYDSKISDSRRLSSSQNYESSSVSGTIRSSIGGSTIIRESLDFGGGSSIRESSALGSTKLSITSLEKPVFTRTITGLNLEPGDTAVFECQLESEANLTWLKDNKVLDDKLADRVSRSSSDDGTHRLELQHVIESDTGTYTAMAKNDEGVSTCTAQLLVHEISEEERQRRKEANAPIFTVRLKDTELLKNTNFRFMVKVKGTPNPTVKFFKDDIPITSGDQHISVVTEKADIGFYELVISDVRSYHAGVYSCKATNEFGQAHCEGNVTVTDHKNIFTGIENDVLLTPGEKPSFSWVKDGKPFDPDERFKVLLGNEDDSLALIFQHVKPEDAGLYTCVASTTTGRISCSAELSVQGAVNPLAREPEKPKISSESKTSEVTVGGSAMLEAKVLGFPKPDVKWYHEGEELKASGRFKFLYEDEDTMTLVIKNVHPRDGGCYKIVAKNELGEDCTELSLVVKGAPKITKKMENVSVKVEETIKITVGVEGSPTPDVKWYKDGKELTQTDRVKFTKETRDEYCLIIENAIRTDAGSYSVVASNEINQCSDFCQVQVQGTPKILKKMEKDVEVSEGEEITFEIEVVSEPSLKIRWMKDGEEIKSDSTKKKITGDGDVHTLRILRAAADDTATYSVEISNDFGVTTDKGKATVRAKASSPVIEKGLTDIVAKEGECEIELAVQVSAYPTPKIKWFLGDTEITEKRAEYKKVEEDNNYKLILKKVTTELKGTYTCKVENEAGSAETSANLTVHSKPKFSRQLEPKIGIEEGAELTLQIECSGCPEPEVTWFKDGQELTTDAHIKITKDSHRSESYSMSLTLIKRSDSGDYEARATNCMGTATTKTYVEVFSKVTETVEEGVVKVLKTEALESSEKAAIAEEEGSEDKHTIPEPTKTKISVSESDWGDVKVEEIDLADEKANGQFLSQGIVEECLDSEISEHSTHKLNIDRGVSIVSLSEDDRTLSRNNSAIDVNEKNILEEEEEEEEEKAVLQKENVNKESEKDESDFWTSLKSPEETYLSSAERLRKEKISEEKKVEIFEAPLSQSGVADESDFVKKKKVEVENDSDDKFLKAIENDEAPSVQNASVTEEISEPATTKPDSDNVDDPVVNALLTRIKKQRSVLEEILTKEAETKKEDEPTFEKPTFKQPLTDQKSSGKDVSFICVVAANPEPEVTWFHDGKEVKIDGVKIKSETSRKEESEDKTTEYSYTLKVTEPGSADAGLYMVKAQNKYGYGESSANLTIQIQETKPEIKSLSDVSATFNEDAVFEAEVISTTEVIVTWVDKNGVKIKSADRFVVTEDKTKGIYKLTIKKTNTEDAGEFTLVASNGAGETKQTAKLSVTEFYQKPTFKVPLKDQTSTGNPVTFKCTVAAKPEPEITWLLDGKEIKIDGVKIKSDKSMKETDDNFAEYTYTLKITEPGSADAGLYMARAENKYGCGESSASLTYQIEEARPEIKNLKDVTTIPNGDGTFEAEVISMAKVIVKWVDKNGEEIRNSDRFVIIEDTTKGIYKLTVKNTQVEDAGEFTLVASNDVGEAKQTAKLIVSGEAPKIVKPIEDSLVKDGAEGEFFVRCLGFPKPEVKWFKEGKELPSDGRISIKTQTEGQVSSTLTIEKFCVDDVGQYMVTATNVIGCAENKFSLKMSQIPPTFEKGLPRSEEVDEGEVLELKCKLMGSPIPALKWLKDGEPLIPSDRVKVTQLPDGMVKLAIEDMKPSDRGVYTLTAENPNGKITGNCAVNVQPKTCKPKILDGLKDAQAVVGKPLKLEMKITGFPAPEVKWLKDGKALKPSQAIQSFNPDTGAVELTIKSVKPEDAGQYAVKVANKLGEVGQEAKVGVILPRAKPKFEASLLPVSAVEGSPARFAVKATGNPKPLIKWSHNGKEVVPDGDHVRVTEEPDGTVALLLDKVTPEDAGEYTATAVNDEGETSCKADLNVLDKKTEKEEMEPSFVRPLNNVALEEDATLILSAPIAGNPIPEVSWEKDGKPLKSDDRVLLSCDGKKVTLEIKNCKPSDAGLYVCHLSNPLGQAKSKANVDVKRIFKEPIFVEKFKDLEQVQGKDAKFVARITGVPKPDVEWFFNGQPVEEGDKYQTGVDGDKYSIIIKNCKPEEAGLYRCCASNRAGKADCVAQLNIVQKIVTEQRAEPPSFLKKISDCDLYKGMTAKFTACCAGFPQPEFEWFLGDKKLSPSSRIKMESEDNGLIRLTITGVDENDVGKYRLRIFNPHGEAECSGDLICDILEKTRPKRAAPKEEPKEKSHGGLPSALTDKPIISRMTDRHLTLSWKPYIPRGPQLPVTYIVEMCKPDGDWFTVRRGIRSCACDVRNLEPFQDYKFRVRVENKYGISDPSPFAETYRQKILPDPPKFVPYLPPGIDFRPETSPYFPKDFDLERPPHDRYEQAPKFLRQEHDTQYGIKNENSNLFWFVYGYPKPTMTYYFNDEPIEMGGRYDCSYTRNGQATLFINKMLERDVGVYEAVAKNEHGEARQRVRLEIAEYPVFIQRPEETYIMNRGSGTLTARVTGVPYPDIKWYKDWQPLATTSRIKMTQTAPDTVTLTINDAILKDDGLYSISASNVAGTVSSSAMVYIEEQEDTYRYKTYGGGRNIKPRSDPLSNYYDIGDELGRGTQGITYHAVERNSGNNYAAKFMHGRSDLKTFMLNELNVMNELNHRKLIRLHDSFETKDLLVLVMELGGGGELLEWLTKQTHYTETDIADYIRQILWGLEYMHDNGFAHLSLSLNDILLARPDSDDIKICDFGLSRRIMHNKLMGLNYGMPEFVAPEVANGEGVSYSADMWSLGIITYILLSGHSPFKGLNDRETLTRIKEGTWKFEEEFFSGISSEARDFITRLLTFKPGDRMEVKAALRHPWLERIGLRATDQYKIKTDNLRKYYSSLRDWYGNANCRTWYRREPLSNAFTHPSKMVYPPAHDYTPEPEFIPAKTTRQFNGRPTESGIPAREPLDYEVGNFKSESHYQNGPDTYLLQLRDVDLPCRLRHYMKVAANREANYTSELPDKHIDWRTPVIRERRKFMDIMDEEIDDERRARINQYGSDDVYSLRRLKHEISCRSDGHAEAEAMLEYKRDGHLPFFREKPQNLAIMINKPAELSCLVVGDPQPIVQWFKNDLVLAETSRIKMLTDQNKRCYLKFDPALSGDVGAYKVVAKNKVGQTVARMRVALASVPLSPDPPVAVEVSDTEILLKWKHEIDDVFTPILCYWLQYKEADSENWIDLAKNIDHEFWIVSDLKPSTTYVFRLSSRNCAGWSAPGVFSLPIETKEAGSSRITVSDTQRQLQAQTTSRDDIAVQEPPPALDYGVEETPLEWTADSNIEAKYQFTSEICKGRFSLIVKGVDKTTNQHVAAKLFEVNSATEKSVAQEFDNIKSLRHERIVTLLAALRPAPNVAVLVMEKLQGADILSYFAARKEYNEDMVVTVLTQVLNGLQYLHWRGLCHLDIQPDNIVLASVGTLQVKLVDFGSVQRVSKLGTVVNGPHSEYSAPEILCNEPAFPQTDIWSLGAVAYVLLSGSSPFRADNPEETKQNIIFVRYRFEHLYKEITQEATRFLMLIFKRTPGKRPTVEECYETRWFLSTEFMIKKRLRASFPGSRLKEYAEAYHEEKSGKGLTLEVLAKAFGEKVLKRSNSIQEELITY